MVGEAAGLVLHPETSGMVRTVPHPPHVDGFLAVTGDPETGDGGVVRDARAGTSVEDGGHGALVG